MCSFVQSQGYGGGTGRLDDFYSFDFDTSTWEQVDVLGEEKPGCRENNGVVISDSSRSIYLFGGYNGTSWLNDLWKVSAALRRRRRGSQEQTKKGHDAARTFLFVVF